MRNICAEIQLRLYSTLTLIIQRNNSDDDRYCTNYGDAHVRGRAHEIAPGAEKKQNAVPNDGITQ